MSAFAPSVAARSVAQSPRWVKGITLGMGLATLAIGAWTFLAPASFYADFPVSGAAWVSTLGHYNEHLAVDFGSAEIGLAVAAVGVAFSRSTSGSVAVLSGFLVFGVLHLGYHLRTFESFSVGSAVTQAVALGTFVVVPTIALLGIYAAHRTATHGRDT